MDNVTRLDIENYGLNQAKPLCSGRTAAEQRAKDYQAHLKRMEVDEDYRYRMMQNEQAWEEAKARGYEHL